MAAGTGDSANRRMKTGGRQKGTPNKPKADAELGGAAPSDDFLPTIKNARATLPPFRMLPIDSLVAYENNARTHSAAQVDMLAKLITEFGWTNPVLIDGKRGIIAGHGRVLAARQLGMDQVPTIELGHLTAAQRRAYVIADNKSALAAGWDDDLLRLELGDLRDEGFDLALTGFDGAELDALFSDQGMLGETDPDAVPEPEAEPITRANDIWLMGRHRLMCGDSTNPLHIDALMNGAQADLCFTSPPYGQQRDYKSGGVTDWDELMQGVFSVLPVKHEAQVLVNLGMIHRDGEWLPYYDAWIEWMRAAGWRRFGWYVWDQGPGLPGDWNGRLAPSHEWVFHFNRVAEKARKTKESKHAGEIHKGQGLRNKNGTVGKSTVHGKPYQDTKIPDSVIRVMRHKGGLPGDVGSHPAVFPADLVSEILTAFSDRGELVFEPFCGSGTQLIGAEKNDRCCFGMELAPVYADVCVKRWQNFTGQAATLEGDGRTFAEIAAERDPQLLQARRFAGASALSV